MGRSPQTDRLPDVLPAACGGDVEIEALGQLGEDWVRGILGRLRPDQRAVLLLRVVGDLSVDEVARIVGKRPGAVRALQHRGLATLRRQLEDGRVPQRRPQMSSPGTPVRGRNGNRQRSDYVGDMTPGGSIDEREAE